MVAADSKAKFLQDAERYVLHGKVPQAIGEYLKIVKFDPNDVLILNTIGDLYLRQGKSTEANRYFNQVAENYVQNNFFLKAIAVYKKILNADPNNLDINSTMASLYAKQGLSIDAKNQYLRLAALFEKEGRAREQMDAYEQVVEIDPSNAAIQRKLAELYLAEGASEKSRSHWIGAARAMGKAGNIQGAADSYHHAVLLNSQDVESMRGYLDCCLKLSTPVPALNQLKQAVESAPDNLDFRELLGQAYLANQDPESAVKVFQTVLSMDDSRYGNFFDVAKSYLEQGEYDRATSSLDDIVPILITRRETERAVQFYQDVLQREPGHILTMVKLASVCSATGDQIRYVALLDSIADHYIEKKSPAEALEYLEKILHADPESAKHRRLHREIFAEVYPDTPYVAPSEPPEISIAPGSPVERREHAAPEAKVSPEIVEADLLLNYGLKEKALGLLQGLEMRDPYDREVRVRLVSIFKLENKNTEAAEQLLLLAVLHRRSGNEEAALSCLSEAKQLSPDVQEYEKDLDGFARRSGIEPEAPAASGEMQHGEAEVDLSSDLLDIFFSNDKAEGEEGEPDQESLDAHGSIPEAYPQDLSSASAAKSLEEQLQEVDFYIRLGFSEEALAKLNEIAKIHPTDSEVISRYEKLGAPAPSENPMTVSTVSEEAPLFGKHAEPPSQDLSGVFDDLDLTETLDNLDVFSADKFEMPEERPSAPTPMPASAGFAIVPPQVIATPAPVPAPVSAIDSTPANEMFADLMEEFGAVSDQEVLRESFEDHFSLGTAYRDMELTEEAIKEFQFALKIADLKKEGSRIIQCCGMLSTCYLKKAMPSSALRWCQTGLGIVDISSHESMALRYDMGIAHSMAGDRDRALECFRQIFGIDPGYRDVAQKIDELKACGSTGPKSGSERHAP